GGPAGGGADHVGAGGGGLSGGGARRAGALDRPGSRPGRAPRMIDRLIGNVLEWAAGHTDEGRYSPVGILFHWTMAALVIFQLFWGWWMGRLPVGGDKVAAHDLH